jgi:acyl-[acyl-carrier-protein]-phospholipid O-acyltransferase/long-chain-fatty-acid--[acyl-carrier-protein] ligase
MGAIPVSQDDLPRDLLRALRTASARIAAGDTVCIFAEGGISRTGSLLPFTRGLEIIMRGSRAPIVPVHIRVEPNSFTSFRRGRVVRTFNPFRRIRATVSFGRPMAPESTAATIRQTVNELGADAACRAEHGADLGDRFLKNARRHPFRPCMTDETGAQLTYAQGAIRALALANALRRELPAGQPVGILLPTGIAAALVNLAAAFLGRPTVNLNYTAGAAVVAQALRKSGVTRLVTSRQFLDLLGWAPQNVDLCMLEDVKPTVTMADELSAVLRFVAGARPGRRNAGNTNSPSALPRDLATILFSSGSTGNPKGVMLSHQNLSTNITAMMQMYGLGPKDRLLGCLPFFHCFGLTATLWLPLTSGLSVVFQRNPLDFKTSGRLIQKHGVTVLLSTPTFLTGYIRRCTPDQLASLRHVAVGAEKLTVKLSDAFERRFGVTPREGYGATELSPFATANIPDAYAGSHVQMGTKTGTVGRPLPGTALRVVNPDTGDQLPLGERGLLQVRGPGVMIGYLGNPERTAEVIENGWYRTGDIASIDEDGFVTLHDRISRFSKIAGEMVPHLNVETAIAELAGKTTERVCVVVGVPDDAKGERLVVVHTDAVEPARTIAALREKQLPNLWIPRENAFVRCTQIPVLGTGKIDLCAVKQLALHAA